MELIEVPLAISITIIGWDAMNRFPKARELGKSKVMNLSHRIFLPYGLKHTFKFYFLCWICKKN